jgi:hypothetical protein
VKFFLRFGFAPAALLFLFSATTTAIGQSVSFAWNPSSSPTVTGYAVCYGLASQSYGWNQDAGSNTATTVSNLTIGQTYYFAVMGYDGAGNFSPYSGEVAIPIPPPPQIIAQPVSQTIIARSPASLAVAIAGTFPATYQWYDGATAIAGATNPILNFPTVSDALAGNYYVTVSNISGGAVSTVATLSVIDPPAITSQPISQSAGLGTNAAFSVAVTGTSPFTFQWFYDASPISTGTKPTLRVGNAAATNAGSYYVIVQNAAGTAISAVATLSITNAFAPYAGVYNGLFYQTNGALPNITVPTAGMLANLVLQPGGAYSARVCIGGSNYSISGGLSMLGRDNQVISRAASGQSNLTVSLHLDMTGVSQSIAGTVSSTIAKTAWSAPLLAVLGTNTLPVPAGSYPMIIPSIRNLLGVLLGQGSVAIASTPTGIVTLAGYMDDLTSVSETVPLSQSGVFPLYFSLYGGQGLAEGWVSLASGVPAGTVTWISPAGTNVLSVY